MPLHAYNTHEQHLRQSVSALQLTEGQKHSHTSTSVSAPIAHQHALIAANKAMQRSQSTTSRPLLRTHSGRSLRASRSIHFGTESRRTIDRSKFAVQQSRRLNRIELSPVQQGAENLHPYEQLVSVSDMGAMEASYDAQPSSYRRLRKAKSSVMSTRGLAELNAPGKNFVLEFGHTRSLRKASSSTSLHPLSLGLRLRRSFQMLKPHRHRPEAPINYQPELTCRPESIALARNEFLKLSTPKQEPSQGSRTPRSTASGSSKTLRKSVRSRGSTLRENDALVTSGQDFPLTTRKSSMSASIRKTIKRVFGRSVSDREMMPPQQVDASHPHFLEAPVKSHAENALDNYCNDDPELLRRNSLYIPSRADVQDVTTESDQLPNIRSLPSSNSVRSTSQSRLTSWTNSSLTGSVRSDLGGSKRLSVIREDGGPHQPSSSAGRHVGGLSVFQQPLQLNQGIQIDSQRIYSALLKRIDQEQMEMENTEAALQEIHDAAYSIPTQKLRPRFTVRRVNSTASLPESLSSQGEGMAVQGSRLAPDKQTQCLTQIDPKSKKGCHRQQLMDRSSMFFGSSTNVEPHTPSPFRKLLTTQRQQCRSQPNTTRGDSYQTQVSLGNERFAESSESIYSKTTSGGRNSLYTSPLGSSEELNGHVAPCGRSQGIATILLSDNVLLSRNAQDRERFASMSASEKGQWNGWLERQMSDLSSVRFHNMGHIRESAQIDPQDVEIGQLLRSNNLCHNASQSSLAPDTPTRHQLHQIQDKSGSSALGLIGHKTKAVVQAKQSLITDHKDENQIAVRAVCTSTNQPSKHNDMGNQHSRSARRPSSNRMARLLKLQKSLPSLGSVPVERKENKPTPQVSMAEDGSYADQATSEDDGLRESSSNIRPENSHKKSSPTAYSLDIEHPSPGYETKTALSARLSRPFDMDVPEYNRPFDSMYLGKIDRPSFENARIARLSVASNTRPLRASKSYGGLGRPRLEPLFPKPRASVEPEPTALPPIPIENTDIRVNSLSNLASNGRRMVSNFLRSRKKDEQALGSSPELAPLSSPAFI